MIPKNTQKIMRFEDSVQSPSPPMACLGDCTESSTLTNLIVFCVCCLESYLKDITSLILVCVFFDFMFQKRERERNQKEGERERATERKRERETERCTLERERASRN